MRVAHALRRAAAQLFDFEALTILQLSDGVADLQIQYGMSPLAEEAASVQTMGFFEGLVELADGTAISSAFAESSWRGDPRTLLTVSWETARTNADTGWRLPSRSSS